MLKRFRDWDRGIRRRFYDGPALLHYPGRRIRGYRSPIRMVSLWLRAFGWYWVTLPGQVLMIVGIFIGLGASTSTLMPLYLLACAVCSLFLVDLVVGWCWRPRLRVRRHATDLAPVGQPLRLTYEVENVGRRPAWQVEVDFLPMPSFTRLPEGFCSVDRLGAGERCQCATTLTAARRGVYALPMPVAGSAFPFGLWRWNCRGELDEPVLVHPNYVSLEHLEVPVGAHGRSGSLATGTSASESVEFLGCREYRYGDSPRHLHALSSARFNELVVKEFREEYPPRVAILLDDCPPAQARLAYYLNRPHEHFEAGLSLTAAVVDYLDGHNYWVDFLVGGPAGTQIEGSGGARQLPDIFAVLARLEPRRGGFAGPDGEQIERLATVGAALFIALDWDEARRECAARLHAAGVGLRVLLVGDRDVPLPGPTDLTVSPAEIVAGRVGSL